MTASNQNIWRNQPPLRRHLILSAFDHLESAVSTFANRFFSFPYLLLIMIAYMYIIHNVGTFAKI
jgi:hypothetical protein